MPKPAALVLYIHGSMVSISFSILLSLPARTLPNLPCKPMKESRLAKPCEPPVMAVFCSTCQMAFKSPPKFSLPLKPIREVLSLMLVAVELVSEPASPLIFTWPTVTLLLIWPYRITSAEAASGKPAITKAIIDFFIILSKTKLKSRENTFGNINVFQRYKQLLSSW